MKKFKNSKVFKAIIYILVCIIFGFAIGFFSAKYFREPIGKNTVADSAFKIIFKMYGMIIIFFIGTFIHIIVHEAGHLLFGLMSGYKFVSFRIGSNTIVKENGKFKLKKFNIPGTAGQCLMMPPEIIDGKFPFVVYNFGGAIMNFIVSAITMLIAIYGNDVSFYLKGFLFVSGVAGIFLGLTNAFPLKIGGISNDGYNVLSMLKDENARTGFYFQLKTNGLQSQGLRIKDMPIETFELEDGADYVNPLNTSMGLLRYYWYLDNMDIEMARKSIEDIIPCLDRMVPLFKYEINCERIFLELVGDCDKSIIDDLYDKTLKKYIKKAKYMIGKKRVLLAYEAFYNRDTNLALKQYEKIKHLASKYAIKGEADMELMISDWIIEKMKTRTEN